MRNQQRVNQGEQADAKQGRDRSRSPRPTPPWRQRKDGPPERNRRGDLTDKGKAALRKERDAPAPQRVDTNEGKQTKAALVDLFAGLRTVHIAAPGAKIHIVLSHAAEKDSFANKTAKKNRIKERSAQRPWRI